MTSKSNPLENEGTFKGHKWGSVPVIVFSAGVSLEARAILALLWTWVNPHEDYSVFPSQKTLAGMLGVSERTVSKYIKELSDNGHLIRRYRKDVKSDWRGHPRARIYELILPEPVTISEDPTGRPSSGITRTPDSGITGRRSSAEQTNEQTNEQEVVVIPQKYLDYAMSQGASDPEAYALACFERGALEKGKRPDPDGERSRQRYVEGVPEDD